MFMKFVFFLFCIYKALRAQISNAIGGAILQMLRLRVPNNIAQGACLCKCFPLCYVLKGSLLTDHQNIELDIELLFLDVL